MARNKRFVNHNAYLWQHESETEGAGWRDKIEEVEYKVSKKCKWKPSLPHSLSSLAAFKSQQSFWNLGLSKILALAKRKYAIKHFEFKPKPKTRILDQNEKNF